jgi:pyrroloquinoline quinone biosynthesis protein B
MRVRVLGSAAGGGFPQWNCGCDNCRDVRAGVPELQPRSQDSLAVSADGSRWLLLNASPDVRSQIEACPALWPRAARSTPIAALALTNGDLDHVLGLFSLRESQRLQVLTTLAIRRGLELNVMTRTLQRFDGQISWHDLEPGQPVSVLDVVGDRVGLSVEAVLAPGKLPAHLSDRADTIATPLHNVGLLVRDEQRGSTLAYFPGVGGPSVDIARALQRADACLFDGTFWSSTELVDQELGSALAETMAHWPLSGSQGSLAWLSEHAPRPCFLTHVNNSNPLLRRGSEQQALLESTGIGIAYDGLELEL